MADLLRQRGIGRLYEAADEALGVLSVARGLTAWTDGQVLWWRVGGTVTSWPAVDPDGAADRLAALARDTRRPLPSVTAGWLVTP